MNSHPLPGRGVKSGNSPGISWKGSSAFPHRLWSLLGPQWVPELTDSAGVVPWATRKGEARPLGGGRIYPRSPGTTSILMRRECSGADWPASWPSFWRMGQLSVWLGALYLEVPLPLHLSGVVDRTQCMPTFLIPAQGLWLQGHPCCDQGPVPGTWSFTPLCCVGRRASEETEIMGHQHHLGLLEELVRRLEGTQAFETIRSYMGAHLHVKGGQYSTYFNKHL